MPNKMDLPLYSNQLLDYLNANAAMIAIIVLMAILSLVGFTKLKNSIVPIGITIIAACQVVQVIQLIFPH